MTREMLVVELLRLRADGLLDVRENVKGDGGSVPIRSHAADCKLRHSGLRCSCWLRSLDELARCLRVMHGGPDQVRTPEGLRLRRLWSNVHRRYIAAERRPMVVKVRAGKPVPAPGREVIGLVNSLDLDKRGNGETRLLCEVWAADVDLQLAAEGVAWISRHFRGAINLPRELVREAA